MNKTCYWFGEKTCYLYTDILLLLLLFDYDWINPLFQENIYV